MEIIDLSAAELIGQGRDRNCYRHPTIDNQCIKVSRQPQKQTRREQVYFSYLNRKKRDMSGVACYLDTVQTSFGEGAVFELVSNENGQLASTLTEAIKRKEISHAQTEELLTELYNYLYDQKICVRDLSPNNIMCQWQHGKPKLIIVDGVSNPGINPLNIRIGCLAHRFIDRSWASLEKKLSILKNKK